MIYIAQIIFIQSFVADFSVEAFNVSILIGFTQFDKLMINFPFVAPGIECGSRKLGPLIRQ